MDKPKRFMNPYLAGFLLGLVVIMSFYLTGRGLGASGAVKSIVVTAVDYVAPSHVENTEYFSKYMASHDNNPIKAWLVFLLIGVFIGGIVSGARSDRLKLKLEHGPNSSRTTRVIMALAGGALFGFGAQLGRGCTSGAALSGMSVLSSAGFISMLAIFGSGFIFAYFFRKLWI